MTEKKIIRAAVIAVAVVVPNLALFALLTSVSVVVQWSAGFIVLTFATAIASALLGLVGVWIAALFTPERLDLQAIEPLRDAVIRSLEEEIAEIGVALDVALNERDTALYERDNPDFRNSPRYTYLDKD